MTAQAKPRRNLLWPLWAALASAHDLLDRASAFGLGLLLYLAKIGVLAIYAVVALAILTPLAKVVWDYWTPVYEQAMRGKAAFVPTAVKAKGAK